MNHAAGMRASAPVRLLFLVGAQRSGTTMLERILSSHSQIHGGPEAHLLTPLAHLGVWANVDKAPYDHIVAGLAQRQFVEALPHGERDYWAACRAYCDRLYGASVAASGKPICLDKTPEYATILPFITRIFPDAGYVVLTRHPLAIFSSFAGSFFEGDYALAQSHEPILERYIPAIAAFLRQSATPFFRLRYEDLVTDPEAWVTRLYEHLGVAVERDTVDYGEAAATAARRSGLGDPITVNRQRRPSGEAVARWADEIAADPAKRSFLAAIVDRLDPDDLATFGYPLETLWDPVDAVAGTTAKARRRPFSAYRLQRQTIIAGRGLVRRSGLVRRLVSQARLACDVLLREA